MFKPISSFLVLFIVSLMLSACTKRHNKPTKHRQHALDKKRAAMAAESEHIKNHYQVERALIQSYETKRELRTKLQNLILVQHEQEYGGSYSLFNVYTSLPFLRYKDDLDTHRIQLEKHVRRLELHHDAHQELICDVQNLICELELINDLLVSYPEYHEEMLALDERRHRFTEYLT